MSVFKLAGTTSNLTEIFDAVRNFYRAGESLPQKQVNKESKLSKQIIFFFTV